MKVKEMPKEVLTEKVQEATITRLPEEKVSYDFEKDGEKYKWIARKISTFEDETFERKENKRCEEEYPLNLCANCDERITQDQVAFTLFAHTPVRPTCYHFCSESCCYDLIATFLKF